MPSPDLPSNDRAQSHQSDTSSFDGGASPNHPPPGGDGNAAQASSAESAPPNDPTVLRIPVVPTRDEMPENASVSGRSRASTSDSTQSRFRSPTATGLLKDVKSVIATDPTKVNVVVKRKPNSLSIGGEEATVALDSQRVVRAAVVVSWNAIAMFVVECILEILIVTGASPYIPFRLDFFGLTMLSAILGFQTLQSVLENQIDATRNSLVVGFTMESFLVAADVLFMTSTHEKYGSVVFAYRLPFAILTFVNIVLIVYIYWSLHVPFTTRKINLTETLFRKPFSEGYMPGRQSSRRDIARSVHRESAVGISSQASRESSANSIPPSSVAAGDLPSALRQV